jgi:hypothetical protein
MSISVTVADDTGLIAHQIKAAEKAFESLQSGPKNRAESAHFVVIGSLPEARLQAIANGLEKTHATATKGLQFEDNDPPWKGKTAVFVLKDAAAYRSYARQIAKRRPGADETNSADLKGETPTMAIHAGAFKEPASFDAALQQRLATSLIGLRAKTEKLPDWVAVGFAKATLVQGTSVGPRKRAIIKLNLPASAAWNNDVPTEARHQVAASLMEYLVYNKAVPPGEFLAAFRPENDMVDVEIPLSAVLEKVNLTPEKLEANWKLWVLKP